MKKATRILALVLAMLMCLCLFAGCKDKDSDENSKNNTTPLVVGYSQFNETFSPFFSETAYDQDVYAMTQISLLASDRTGAIIMNGIEGETHSYNGKDYTPKTADTDLDPRYAMCGVLLLLGIFVMVSGNKRKLTLVSKEKKEN